MAPAAANTSADAVAPAADKSAMLEGLYRDHRDELVDFLRRQFGAGPPDPEDIAQLAFEKLLRRKTFSDLSSVRAFLWSTAKNLSISSLRRNKTRASYDYEVQRLYFARSGDEMCPTRVVEAEQQLSIIAVALRHMPENRRQAFVLHRIEGLNKAEVARRLGISRTAVVKRLARAAAEIDDALEAHCGAASERGEYKKALKPRPDNPPSRSRALRKKRHRPALRVAVPLAAAAAIATIALSIATRQPSRPFDSNPPVLANYASERGEIKALTLPDGSRVTLASLTELSVSLSSGARAAALIKGAAVFDVAADPARPFSVDAGGVSAAALGTVFEVRNNGGVVRVAVAEGEVELARPFLLANQPTSLVQRNALTAGEFASLRLDSDQVIFGSFKAQDFASWRQSRLNYEGATLKEIIADANRYSARRIVLQGDHEKVQSLTITGFFNSDDVDEMLATLTEVFPVTIERATPEKIVVRID